jgi:LacI family transcriptional regulator
VPHTTNAYFSALMNAFEEFASDRGFELMQVLSGQDPQREYKRVQALLRYNIGGLILLPTRSPGRTLDLLAASGTPTVIVDRPAHDDRFDEVSFDNRRAMEEATRHLVALGHRRLLFMVRERALVVSRQRVAGLMAAVRSATGKVSAEVVECASDEVSVTSCLSARFLRPGAPTAGWCSAAPTGSPTRWPRICRWPPRLMASLAWMRLPPRVIQPLFSTGARPR